MFFNIDFKSINSSKKMPFPDYNKFSLCPVRNGDLLPLSSVYIF